MNVNFNGINLVSSNMLSARTNSPRFYLNNKDTVSFSGTISSNAQINELKNEKAKQFFSQLYEKSPEKCKVLLGNEEINEYCNTNYGFFSDEYGTLNKENLEVLTSSLDKLSPDDIKYVISSLSGRLDATAEHLLTAMVLYSNNTEVYEYVLNSPKIKESVVYSSGYSKDLCRYICNLEPRIVDCLSLNSIREIQKANAKNFDYSKYTSSSNSFLTKSDESDKMSAFLEQNVCEGSFIAYRGEKSSWMFDSIPLEDKMLEKRIRLMAFLNPKSRKIKVFPNNHKYDNSPEESIYDYINKKKNLTLADAMLVAQFGDKRYINLITDKINNAIVTDSHFKSFTIDKKFASRWARTKNGKMDSNMLSMISKTVIAEGNEVGYDSRSGQFEFIVNNNNKEMTFSNARYDRDTNTFYFDSVLKPAA